MLKGILEMKTESKWNAEVSQAYKKWKRDNVKTYDTFRKWNGRQRARYFKSKSHEVEISDRVNRILYG